MNAAEHAASIWWFHDGNKAIRMGDWKQQSLPFGEPWELYHLAVDRQESRDLAVPLSVTNCNNLSRSGSAMSMKGTELASRDLPQSGCAAESQRRREFTGN